MPLNRRKLARLRGMVRQLRNGPMPSNGYEYGQYAITALRLGVEFAAIAPELLDAAEAHLRNPPPPVRRAERGERTSNGS